MVNKKALHEERCMQLELLLDEAAAMVALDEAEYGATQLLVVDLARSDTLVRSQDSGGARL